MNDVCLIGRLTKDPKTKILNTGTQIANFVLAVNRTFKNKEGNYDTDFIPVQVIGKSAEYVGNYVTKGRLVAIQGSIRVDKYQDKDGNNKIFTKVVANNVTSLDKKPDTEKGGEQFQAVDDDDIPF